MSAKRYVLFNRDRNGAPVVRKASAHGLGDVELPTGYKARYEHPGKPVIKDENGSWLAQVINFSRGSMVAPKLIRMNGFQPTSHNSRQLEPNRVAADLSVKVNVVFKIKS